MTDGKARTQNLIEERYDRSQQKGSAKFYAVWTIQVLLALVFLFAGVAKLVMPAEAMKGPVPIPVVFLRFIGVCELLGALGLILPGLLRIRRELTSLAASGLVIIMIGATVVNAMSGLIVVALITLVIGLLAAYVAYERRLPKRLPGGSRESAGRSSPLSI
jgi:uncharacterized membrane protein